MFVVLPTLLTPDELAQLRGVLASAPWVDGRSTAGPHAARVKHNEQVPPDAPAARQGRAIVEQALRRNPLFFSAALPSKWVPPQFNRYRPGADHYGAHVDNALRQDDAGLWVRSDLSCTVFLSDPQRYEGGALRIQHGLGAIDVRLAAGDAVLYPATTVHEVLPVTRGERLACFFWVQSLVRDMQQRELLFGMDQAMQDVRKALPEHPANTRLAAAYHNLMRMWSDN